MADNPIATAYVEVRPDTSTFQERLKSDIDGTVRTIAQGLATVQIGQVFGEGLREFEGARDAAAQTAAAIRSTGGAANVTADDVATLSDRLGEMAAIDNDLVREGANLLLTFTNIRNEVGEGNNIFDRATTALVDMAAALGTDAPSAAIQLGKALNDPVQGLTALTRAGVSFNDTQKETIEGLVATGDTVQAQSLILDELTRQFGGSAAAQASAMDRIAVASGDMKESIGAALVPLLEQAVPLVERAVQVFEAMPTPVQTAGLALGGLAVAARPINETVTLLRTLNGETGRLASLSTRIGGLGSTLGPVGAAVGLATAGWLAFRDAQAETEANVRTLTDAINDQNAPLQTNLLRSVQERLGEGGTEALNQLGIGFEEVRDRILQGQAATRALAIELEAIGEGGTGREVQNLREEFERSAVAMLNAAIASGEWSAAQIEAELAAAGFEFTAAKVRDALADGVVQTDELVGSSAPLTGIFELLRSSGEGAAAGVAAVGGAADEARVPTQTLAEYMRDLNDELAELLDISGSLPVVQADLRDALAAAADEAARLREENASGEERFDSFVQAIERGIGNVDDYARALIDQGASADEAAFRTNLLIDDLFALAGEYGVTRDAAEELRTQLGLDYPDVTATVRLLGLAETLEGLASVQEALRFGFSDAYGDRPLFGPDGLRIQARASGGPVAANTPYLVGEEGPELFMPYASGGIVSNADLLAAIQGRPTPHGGEHLDARWATA